MGGGKIAYALLRLLVLMVLARLLAPADFGVLSAALVAVGFSAIFSQLGIAPAIVQRPILERRHLEAAFSISTGFGLLLGALLWLGAPEAAAFFRIPAVAPVLRVLAIMFPIEGLSVVAESLVQRELRFRWLAVAETLTFAVGYGIVGIGLAVLGFGVWALVGAQLAQVTIYTAVLLAARPPAFCLWPERGAAADLLYYGGGFTASKIANYLALQLDNLIVGRWLGPAALGFYGRAYELMAAAPALVGEAVDRVLFPALALVQTDRAALRDAFRRGAALLALVTLPLSIAICALAPELVPILLGPKWTAVTVPFQILALGMFLRTSYRISDITARATGAVYRRAWRQTVYMVCVALGAWFGRHWGIAGVATGVLASLTVNYLLMAHLGLRLTGLSWGGFWRAQRPAATLALAIGALAWGGAELLRPLALGPGPLLLAMAALLASGTALLVRFAPAAVLGEDGRWVLAVLREFLRPAPLPVEPEPPPPPLVRELAAALGDAGVRYCQWKGHRNRQRWVLGRGDLDLLVHPADAARFAAVAERVGFRPTRPVRPRDRSDVVSFFGHSPELGRLIHAHVHYHLIVGRSRTILWHFPFEEALLATAQANGLFAKPAPDLDLVLLAVRLLEQATPLEALRPAPLDWLRQAQPELTDLRRAVSAEALGAALRRHLPELDPAFFARILVALDPAFPNRARVALRRELARRLRRRAAAPPLSARVGLWTRRLLTLGGRVTLRPSRQQLARGGSVLAIVGTDGSGKTTCTAALREWLLPTFDVRTAHLGRPPRGLPRLAVGAALRVMEALDGRADAPSVPVRYLRLFYHLTLAQDRYRLYRSIRRFVDRGGLAICERYPVPQNGAFAGPQIEALADTVPWPGFARFLARHEAAYYARIAPPDGLIVLQVDPDVAVRRKVTEPPDYVRRRAQLALQIDWAGARTHLVDANRPFDIMIQDAKGAVWSAIRAQ